MKNRYLLLLCCVAVLLSSCAHVYAPALFHQDIAYQPKPTSFDKEQEAGYVSLGLNTYTNQNLNDVLVSGQLNLSKGYVFDNFNLAYGAFGVLGDYQNGSSDKAQPDYFRDKFFGAGGGRFSVNAYVHKYRADFRFIGLEAAYSHEFGDYTSFRKQLAPKTGYYIDVRTDLFTIGLTTQVIFHNQDNTDFQHGIRGFLGTTFGNNNINNTYYRNDTATESVFRNLFPKASYFIKYKDYFGTIEAGSAVLLRVGYKF